MFEYLIVPLFLVVLILIFALPIIFVYLFVRLTEEVFEQVGFGHWHASMMVFGSILGSMVDIPLHASPITAYPDALVEVAGAVFPGVSLDFHPVFLAVNLGGCLIPVFVSLDILRRRRAPLWKAAVGTLVVALITYLAAIPVADQGILLPVYLSPTLAAVTGLILARGYMSAPSIAYISGTMGTLLGADVLNLLTPGVLPALSPPGDYSRPMVLSIGGAGVFDGIFLTGVLSVLLAAVIVCLFRRSCENVRMNKMR